MEEAKRGRNGAVTPRKTPLFVEVPEVRGGMRPSCETEVPALPHGTTANTRSVGEVMPCRGRGIGSTRRRRRSPPGSRARAPDEPRSRIGTVPEGGHGANSGCRYQAAAPSARRSSARGLWSGSGASRYLLANVPSKRAPFSRVVAAHLRQFHRESSPTGLQIRVTRLPPRNPGGTTARMPLLGLPLPSDSLAIRGHPSGVKSENRAVTAVARSAARHPSHAGDSQSTHESRRRARRLPAARASTASGTFPSASGDRCSPCSIE